MSNTSRKNSKARKDQAVIDEAKIVLLDVANLNEEAAHRWLSLVSMQTRGTLGEVSYVVLKLYTTMIESRHGS